MTKPLSFIIVVFLLASGCGGGFRSASTSKSFTAAAQIGELVDFTIDQTALTYSYTIKKSAFGCDVASADCHTGSGTLTLNSDGSYSPSQFPNSIIHSLSNGLMIGSVKVPVNGTNIVVPVTGLQNPATTLADIADAGGTIYNWVEYQCQTAGNNCLSKVGTIKINIDGTFYACSGYNLGDASGVGAYSGNAANCTAANTGTGSLTNNNDGTWAINYSVGSNSYKAGNLIAFKDLTSGQRVAIMDINDTTNTWANNGWGTGSLVASTQITVVPTNVIGIWNTNGSGQERNKITVTANDASSVSFSSVLYPPDGGAQTTNTGTLTLNSPWTGISFHQTGGEYVIMSGTGMYNLVLPGMNYFETGYKQ